MVFFYPHLDNIYAHPLEYRAFEIGKISAKRAEMRYTVTLPRG